MADSLFKGPDQIQSGLDIQKEIQKRTETKPLDIVVKLAGALAKGKGAELKRNMSRIQTNLEDEQSQLKGFAKQQTEHATRIKTLTDSGMGSLEAGIFNEMVAKGDLKNLGSWDGLQITGDPKLVKFLQEEVGKIKESLDNKTKEYRTLRSSYDINNPEAGILAENLEEEALFTKPYRESLYEIVQNQKKLGNNNLLDVLTRREKRNDYSLIKDGLEKENNLQLIINATRESRKNLKEYSPSYTGLAKFLEPDIDENNTRNKKDAQDAESKLNTFLADSQEWAIKNKRQNSTAYQGYFFPITQSTTTQELRNKNNYPSDLQSFQKEYPEYSNDVLRDIYTGGAVHVNTMENELAQTLIFDSDPDLKITSELSSGLEKNLAYQYLRAAPNQDLDLLPDVVRDWVASRIPKDETKRYVAESVDLLGDDFIHVKTVEEMLNKLGELDKYENLDNTFGFSTNVIAQAKAFVKLYDGLDMRRAVEIAVSQQRFGLIETKKGMEVPVIGLKIGTENAYQTQPRLSLKNNKTNQFILNDITFDITEDNFQSWLEALNINKIYNFTTETIESQNPQQWKDGQRFSIGQYEVTFSSQPDSEGNNWSNTTP